MRVLLVEDNPRKAKFVVQGLQQEGISIDHAKDGNEGQVFATVAPYDLSIIDLMLPNKDGLSLIHYILAKKMMAPILILSARNSVDDRIKGLQLGGSNYLVKPFTLSELLDRLQALHRRGNGLDESDELCVGDLRFDLTQPKAFRRATRHHGPLKNQKDSSCYLHAHRLK